MRRAEDRLGWAVAAALYGCAAVAFDVWSGTNFAGTSLSWGDLDGVARGGQRALDVYWSVMRAGLFGLGLLLYAAAFGADPDALGLRWRPRQGWRWWIRGGLLIGLVIGVALAAQITIMVALDRPLDADPSILERWPEQLFGGVVVASVFEELVYRFVLCVPLVALAGRWPTIAVSGVVFAFIHYPNLEINNGLAGFFFAWAFLHSRCLLVPIALHAAGNLAVVLGNLAFALSQ